MLIKILRLLQQAVHAVGFTTKVQGVLPVWADWVIDRDLKSQSYCLVAAELLSNYGTRDASAHQRKRESQVSVQV